jgi:Ni/Co efflux regulator RcnB
MKKLALIALAAAMATIGLASAASAGSRSGDDEWPRHERNDGNRWDDRRGDDRQARRGHDRDDEWRRGDHRRHWRHHHRYPRYAYRNGWRDGYCFVKKVRRDDEWGNAYIKRVRICR